MAGRYQEVTAPWYETRIVNCSYCGKMIAGQYWQDDAFPSDKFCEPSCAELKLELSDAAAPEHRRAYRQRRRSGGA